MGKLSGLLTALNIAGNVANTIGTVAGAAKNVAGAFGGWGQTGNSQSSGGSTSQGGGYSESGSQSGTNVQQVNDWLKQAYAYQGQEAAMQGKYNSQSLFTDWECCGCILAQFDLLERIPAFNGVLSFFNGIQEENCWGTVS